jgi:hypothetical protein
MWQFMDFEGHAELTDKWFKLAEGFSNYETIFIDRDQLNELFQNVRQQFRLPSALFSLFSSFFCFLFLFPSLLLFCLSISLSLPRLMFHRCVASVTAQAPYERGS